MANFHRCPACGQNIPPERFFASIAICSCGWNMSVKSQKSEKEINTRINTLIFFSAIIILASFFQAVNWDTYFFKIIPLKAKEMAGIATPKDLYSIVEICQNRHKYDCAKKAYYELYHLNKDLQILGQLATLQLKTGESQAAVNSFQQYVELGGKDLETIYHYAQALGQVGKIDEAVNYYRRVLAEKPNTLQITITRNYVSLLMNSKRYSEARAVLSHYRKKANNTAYFMEKEFQALNRILGQNRSKG